MTEEQLRELKYILESRINQDRMVNDRDLQKLRQVNKLLTEIEQEKKDARS